VPIKTFLLMLSLSLFSTLASGADELLQMIQQDLTDLGYETGNTTGEATTKTAVAISRFQAEHSLEVTGEASPQLAGIIMAAKNDKYVPAASPAAMAPPPPAPAPTDAAVLQAAQQACLQEKVAAAEAANKKKRGFGSLISAVGRTATQFGNSDLARGISDTSRDVYDINATASDLDSAAKDLGLTPDEVEACRNPSLDGAKQ